MCIKYFWKDMPQKWCHKLAKQRGKGDFIHCILLNLLYFEPLEYIAYWKYVYNILKIE